MSLPMRQVASMGLIFLGLLISLWAGNQYLRDQVLSHPEQFAQVWQRDLDRLKAAQVIPPEWESLRSVDWTVATPVAQTWLSHMEELEILPSLPNPDPEGCCLLRILLIGWDDEVQAGAIVQYSLIDGDSGNLLWELGRTFVLQERQPLTEGLSAPLTEPLSEE